MICAVVTCGKVATVRGYCPNHYRRLRLYGDPEGVHPSRQNIRRTCLIEGCGLPVHNRGMCQTHHWRWKYHGDPHYVRPIKPPVACSVDGCERIVKGRGLCAKHLYRARKGTPLDWDRPKLAPKRYRVVIDREHPLAFRNGRITVHRQVLFGAIGFDRVPCYWCGTGVTFGQNLVVDHLNHDRHDNRRENLVAACASCNCGRTINNPHVRAPGFTSV